MVGIKVNTGIKRLILSFCLFLLVGLKSALGQQADYFPHYSTDTVQAFKLASQHRTSFKTFLPVPVGVSTDYKNHYKKIINSGANHIYYNIRYSNLADTILAPYVKQVYQRIVKTNKNLPPTTFYLTRNPSENAFAMPDGTIFLNVGLLSKLENESQLAFIICHEISHVYFKHSQNRIKKGLDKLYGKEFQGEVKKIVKEEYNINSKLEALALDLSLNSMYHNRKDEKQADSMGYVLLSNSGYDASQAYSALKLLDKIDDPYSMENLDLSRFFSCQDFNFAFAGKPATSKSIFNIKADTSVLAITDTLKSHPDCDKRMRYIQQLVQVNPAPQPVIPENAARFNYIVAISRREVLQSYFDFGYYDHALFNSLLMLKNHPESVYLNAMVTLSLFELKKHLQNHTYYKVVTKISDDLPENFRQLLTVLHTIKIADIKGFAQCFNHSFKVTAEPNEFTLAARYTYLVLNETDSEAEELKKQYIKTYKGGRFERLLFAGGSSKKQSSAGRK